jgi:hypothetical protein
MGFDVVIRRSLPDGQVARKVFTKVAPDHVGPLVSDVLAGKEPVWAEDDKDSQQAT